MFFSVNWSNKSISRPNLALSLTAKKNGSNFLLSNNANQSYDLNFYQGPFKYVPINKTQIKYTIKYIKPWSSSS